MSDELPPVPTPDAPSDQPGGQTGGPPAGELADTPREGKKRDKKIRGQMPLPKLPQLSWTLDDAALSLQCVYEHVRDDAMESATWYARARRPKRMVAYSVRFVAIFLAGMAAIFPLIQETLRATLEQAGHVSPFVTGVWTSILLTLAAGAIAFDRVLGYSSGWVRYMRTEQQIRHTLELFEMDWESQRASWQGRDPTMSQVAGMLQRARDFADQINRLVRDETNAWLEEFQRSLKQLDDLVQSRAEEAKESAEKEKPGAVTLVVHNGDKADGGWKIEVDGHPEQTRSGKTAVLTALAPGLHVVRITGLIGNVPRYAEIAANVPSGGMINLEATLS